MYEDVKKLKDMIRHAFAKSKRRTFSKDEAYSLIEQTWTKYLEAIVKGGKAYDRGDETSTQHRG